MPTAITVIITGYHSVHQYLMNNKLQAVDEASHADTEFVLLSVQISALALIFFLFADFSLLFSYHP